SKVTLVLCAVLLAVQANKDDEKSREREKRQHQPLVGHHPRRSGRPPPYAVQMEPIGRYSQRDPLYKPLAEAKTGEELVPAATGYYEEPIPYNNYYPTEPEPIIEIIIKESNESLPTPAPPPRPSLHKPKKEPIQVFYVKYEKKQAYGEDKPRVVYDVPVPALTPVEEHETIQPDNDATGGEEEEEVPPASPAPPEPSTTLRAIIRPDSEVYHADSGSGLRVTFGTDQLPPNNHSKRSGVAKLQEETDDDDEDAPPSNELPSVPSNKPAALLPPGSKQRTHGPYAPLQPLRVGPTVVGFPQQRVVNSFAQAVPTGNGFAQQPQFHHLQVPPHLVRNQQYQQSFVPQQRPAITVQGLPEVQQRLPFNSFAQPQRLAAAPHLQNYVQLHQLPPSQSPAVNFLADPHRQQYEKQQQREQEKQRYFDQQRLQIEQKRLQEQQRHHEQLRALEQRRKQEEQQQQQKYQQYQQQQQQQQQQQSGEILKAIPKLEQHYAIRENPLHPGPFPPNPQYAEIPQTSFGNINNQIGLQQSNLIQQTHQQQIPLQHPGFSKFGSNAAFKQQQYHQQPDYQNQQQFFAQNLPTAQQQRPSEPPQPAPPATASIWGRAVLQGKQHYNSNEKIYATPVTKTSSDKYASTPNSIRHSPAATTPRPTTTTTTTTTTPTPATTPSTKNEAKIRENIANLPDEVPDDIRQQLLSSGILGNADIQILDYDKVGGINIADLPPEALANFYGAGGAAATSASEPVPQIAKRPKLVDNNDDDEVQTASASSSSFGSRNAIRTEEVTLRPGGVEMKVVRFDPNSAQGQGIAERHIQENATRLGPVSLSESAPSSNGPTEYNRYLPLKVSGASFPIPDAPELTGKRIGSVVVLAPVDYGQQQPDQSRHSRRIAGGDVQAIKFLAGESLKQLVRKPSAENYKRWLDHERQTEPQRQSVVLLVTTPRNTSSGEKEIFMYDVASESVSKLAGDLSSAFVDAAESNSDADEDPMDSAGH
ncbi:transcription factor SPT20-like, partial [Copidosoma floridanum]|uniref:transcription factor SPT20-like n=1 Tax=Copidosoma floridanum TaxID=29053 RepID=UPI0006C95D86